MCHWRLCLRRLSLHLRRVQYPGLLCNCQCTQGQLLQQEFGNQNQLRCNQCRLLCMLRCRLCMLHFRQLCLQRMCLRWYLLHQNACQGMLQQRKEVLQIIICRFFDPTWAVRSLISRPLVLPLVDLFWNQPLPQRGCRQSFLPATTGTASKKPDKAAARTSYLN